MAAACERGTEPLVVSLWRCEACGKWSHAKRRPAHHQRFVPAFTQPPSTPPDVSHIEERPVLNADHGYSGDHLRGWWIACGPFARWNATRVEFREA